MKEIMPVGKYKDWEIERIDDCEYLEWAYLNMKCLTFNQKVAIKEVLDKRDHITPITGNPIRQGRKRI